MEIKIALAGNPNCGKTTLFNALTGSSQYVGNWPGVTVEKKEGRWKGDKNVIVQDLPGIYSLSPYTLEEVVARSYLVTEKPDAILNIVDGTNIERNLYLSTQLVELGIPVVMAVNMMDLVRKNGDRIDLKKLGETMGCTVVEMSALKEEGCTAAAQAAVEAARQKKGDELPHVFTGSVEHALAHIEESIQGKVADHLLRWYAIKLFERDEKVMEELALEAALAAHLEAHIADCEKELDDDAESTITNQRYAYIHKVVERSVKKNRTAGDLTLSDRIDRIVTNRLLALPIFALVMFLVYYVSVTTVGGWATDWANDGVFGEGWYLLGEGNGPWIPGIPALLGGVLDALHCADWLKGLILDGIIAGVGMVLGFVPQMLVLFLFLAFLEECGYMARIAFIMDRIFRRFGLSGKSFIPILIGTGCGVPGIMASRTIENDRDRKMTIMTTTFIPCGAKLPFIAMVAGAIFGGAAWVAPSAYFVGIAAILCSGIILKKTRLFMGDPAPFVMELPAYHMPTAGSILRSTGERAGSFIKKAGSIILLSTIVVWFTTYFGFVDGAFCMLTEEQLDSSLLGHLGGALAWIFAPNGFGSWQATVASITGLVAKENIVSTMGILYGAGEGSAYGDLAASFTAVSGYAFLTFNLLCAPCFAAIGAIRREMNDPKWFWAAIGYQCGFAWLVSLAVNQIGSLIAYGQFGVWTVAALAAVVVFFWLLLRPAKGAAAKA